MHRACIAVFDGWGLPGIQRIAWRKIRLSHELVARSFNIQFLNCLQRRVITLNRKPKLIILICQYHFAVKLSIIYVRRFITIAGEKIMADHGMDSYQSHACVFYIAPLTLLSLFSGAVNT